MDPGFFCRQVVGIERIAHRLLPIEYLQSLVKKEKSHHSGGNKDGANNASVEGKKKQAVAGSIGSRIKNSSLSAKQAKESAALAKEASKQAICSGTSATIDAQASSHSNQDAPSSGAVVNLASGSHFSSESNRAPTSNKDNRFALETKRAVNFGNSKIFQLDDDIIRQREINNIIAFQTALYGKPNFKTVDAMSRKEMIEYCFSSDLEVVRATRTFRSTLEWAVEKGIMPR